MSSSFPELLSNLYRVGDKVKIDGFEDGYILEKNIFGDSLTFKIRTQLCNKIYNNVSIERVTVVNLYDQPQSTNRSGLRRDISTATSQQQCPSSAHYHQHQVATSHTNIPNSQTQSTLDMQSSTQTPQSNLSNVSTLQQPNVNSGSNNGNMTNLRNSQQQSTAMIHEECLQLKEFKQCLKKSYTTSKYKTICKNPLYIYLKDGHDQSLESGWIRSVINNREPVSSVHLSKTENMILLVITSIFCGYSNAGVLSNHSYYTTYAFGINEKTSRRIMDRFVSSDFTMERKTRDDKGKNIFNSHKVRERTFTPFNSFKKKKYRDSWRETTEKIPNDILVQEYQSLSDNEKHAYELMAERDLERSTSLWDEIKDVLKKTKGRVTFKQIADHLGNIVSTNTIRKFLKSKDGFHMRKDRILPHLDTQAKTRRYEWAQTFWLFWTLARHIPSSRAKLVLIHMDEKWFYAIRTRTNNKVLGSIGLTQNFSYVQHKSHIGKEMYIVVTGYILHDGNDICKGGKVIPIALVRVGKMVKATQDSYKRVYKPDGRYWYPKIPANILRKKGEMYFKSCELTGTNEGTEKKPKISLLKVYQDIIIPAIEEKIVRKYNEGGRVKVIIVKQEDNAGPHGKKSYLEQMYNEFWNLRQWILFNQPPNSPMTNVHDTCIFPMLSKVVSWIQSIFYGARLLKGNQLYVAVKKAWEDPRNLVAMARAFAGHSQIVTSILNSKGDNKFLSDKGGLSFGVRKAFIPDEEREGVVAVDISPQTEAHTATGSFLLNQEVNKMKLPTPKLDEYKDGKLTKEMIHILENNIDRDLMSEELKLHWDSIRASNSTNNEDIQLGNSAINRDNHDNDFDDNAMNIDNESDESFVECDDDDDFWGEPFYLDEDIINEDNTVTNHNVANLR